MFRWDTVSQAFNTCADVQSPIAWALKTRADDLPLVFQAEQNMSGSCSSYSPFWARWAKSCSSCSSPLANTCARAILYSSRFKNNYIVQMSYPHIAQAGKTCSTCRSRSSPVSYRRQELARATVSWSIRGVKMCNTRYTTPVHNTL